MSYAVITILTFLNSLFLVFGLFQRTKDKMYRFYTYGNACMLFACLQFHGDPVWVLAREVLVLFLVRSKLSMKRIRVIFLLNEIFWMLYCGVYGVLVALFLLAGTPPLDISRFWTILTAAFAILNVIGCIMALVKGEKG